MFTAVLLYLVVTPVVVVETVVILNAVVIVLTLRAEAALLLTVSLSLFGDDGDDKMK